MEITKLETRAKVIVTIQSDKEITATDEQKAILLAEVNINSHSGFCILEDGTKILYRCHMES